MHILDLFSGGGGLTEGFLREQFHPVAHVEMDKSACSTLKTRLFFNTLKNNNNLDDYYAYITNKITLNQVLENNFDLLNDIESTIFNQEINENSEKILIKSIKRLMNKQNISNIDGIIGGPPCQAYSCAGRGRLFEDMKKDPRNYLYNHYVKFLEEFKPDFFVFENVPGMISAETNIKIFPDFESKLRNLNYAPDYKILSAVNFNVLQNRRRLIVVGIKDNANPFFDYDFENNNVKNFKVWDLLTDLPKLQAGEGDDSPRDYIQHSARKHNNQDREIYRQVIKAWNQNHKRIKYDELPDDLKSHKNKKSFLDRFKIVAGDLNYSHTIMAHLSKDGHYFIHPDIEQARSITVREAARIQSFPDNYKFEGSRTSQFKQIGNAVPPLMAQGLAKRIKDILY